MQSHFLLKAKFSVKYLNFWVIIMTKMYNFSALKVPKYQNVPKFWRMKTFYTQIFVIWYWFGAQFEDLKKIQISMFLIWICDKRSPNFWLLGIYGMFHTILESLYEAQKEFHIIFPKCEISKIIKSDNGVPPTSFIQTWFLKVGSGHKYSYKKYRYLRWKKTVSQHSSVEGN